MRSKSLERRICMGEKDVNPITGAGEHTPSIPYYFSWINNTNEGSTERQTLINLDFFRYMKETYGMQIRIYAWDAGNFDGAAHGYGDLNSENFRSQYPEGYKNVVEKAAGLGIRFGLWGSPDGFGDTQESEKERVDFFVHLCRDYHFAAFKLDGVCGKLRREKAGTYAAMIEECRKYSPDLILLNHRLDFYEAQKYITTFLWNGAETYTDVLSSNRVTAPHPRAYTFSRGLVTDDNGNLIRLAEDHGVCLSSSLDYFEDELIYQAFGRCLITAPEIYGNPWFLKDYELPRLAYIYRLHAKYSDILVNGMILPPEYGANAVSRGDDRVRFICTGNSSWEKMTVSVSLDKIGLSVNEKVRVCIRFPFNEFIGDFDISNSVRIEIPPFRAMLIEASAISGSAPVLSNCKYEVIRDNGSVPTKVNLLQSNGGEIYLLQNDKEPEVFLVSDHVDDTEKAPKLLGTLDNVVFDIENAEQLYESAVFSADNDSLEARCIKRSCDTLIPEVKAARDAFFNQKTYRLRGCESRNLFDGDQDSFFDSQSKTYCGGFRIDGGCLRVDAGEILSADRVEITCFDTDEETREVKKQIIPNFAETSVDLKTWSGAPLREIRNEGAYTSEIIKFLVHTTYKLNGKKVTAVYTVSSPFRYLRIEEPMDRIYSVRFFNGADEIKPGSPFANNLQAHYKHRKTEFVKTAEITIPDFKKGSYLALAVNGKHGAERVYACLSFDDKLYGFPRRAPDYRGNVWEHIVCTEEQNNTFYYTLPESMKGKTVTVYAVFSDSDPDDTICKVWLCDYHR